MMDAIAKFLRSMNARLVKEDRWLAHKFFKIFFVASSVLYKTRTKVQGPDFYTIDNFDVDLRLKMDRSKAMGASIYWSGFHEFHEFLFLNKFLRPNMVVVDAGANMGEFTLFCAKRVPQGKVLSFEPMPEMHSLLLENIKLNALANVAAYQVWLSDSKGTLPIYELEGANEGLSTLYPGESKTGRKIDIVLKSFDEEFDGFGVTSVDFIKLDIEGGELGALKGLQTVLSKFKPVVMVEINKKTYQAAGYEPTTIFDFFQERNYKPYLISKHGSLVSCSGVPDNANVVFKPV